MELSFLEQASLWGQMFEIAVKRGVLQNLIHRGLLPDNHSVLEPWKELKNGDINNQLVKKLNLTDPNAKEWAGTMVRHLYVLGYGLGWTAMRECLKHSRVRKPKLEAIWCPLTLPGQHLDQDEERETTAQEFQKAFNLPGNPDSALVSKGQPARADFFLWLSSDQKTGREDNSPNSSSGSELERLTRKDSSRKKFTHFILCLEFSYNAPAELEDFSTEKPHREEIARYARYMDSRGIFSRVCAEVEGEEFELSSKLKNQLLAFSGVDKPLFKLCQASSYTERLIHLLRSCRRLEEPCSTRAIAVTSNGFESLAAHFIGQKHEPDPRARLMKSLGEAYCNIKKQSDLSRSQLEAEISLVFNNLVQSLPGDFRKQVKQELKQTPNLGGYLHFQFQENVEGFYNPEQKLGKDQAIAAIEQTKALIEFFGANPQSEFTKALDQQEQHEQLSLRQVHAAAVVAGLNSAQAGRLNVIALEGNPGIGKTTAIVEFLKKQSEGFLFLYVSPRVVINRDVTSKLARKNDNPSGILTLTSNSMLIAAASKWYEQQVKQHGWGKRKIDSAVVVDGIQELIHPNCNTAFVTPEQEHEIDCNVVPSIQVKVSLNEREDSIERPYRPGVLRTLANSARQLLKENSKVNRLVITAATQGYRYKNQKTTVDSLNCLFNSKANTKQGREERSAFGKRIPTIIVMVDELAGDGAGTPFVHRLAEWLHQQFIEPFEGDRTVKQSASQSPFKVVLIIADASLSNEVVLNNYLNSGERAPDKVLISKSYDEAPFRLTGTFTKVGPKKYPTLHVMTNSFPASELSIDYSIRLSPITPGLTSDGKKQTIRQAIREQVEDELLMNSYLEIKRGLEQKAQQLIFFAQDKAFLRKLQEKLTTGTNAILQKDEVEVLDQSVQPHQRSLLVQEPRRDEVRVFLMTSSGSRGVSFPKTDWIIAAIPRFNIEGALMEVAQLIYRGRGMYTNLETGTKVSGDHQARKLVMLINDFIIVDEDIDRSRIWLRQSNDLLTLLVMLRSTIHTRIKGDAGLKRQRIAFVPVGSVGDEELLSLMSEDVRSFLHEASIFIRDSYADEAKGIVKKTDKLIRKIFAHFNLTGQASDRNAKSFVNYQTLEALSKTVSRSSSWLLPSLEHDALVIPDNLTCVGPFWIEDWSDRQIVEQFNFEGWRSEIKSCSRELLGLLKRISEDKIFPPKLKRPAEQLRMVLIRKQGELNLEYSTLQELSTENMVVSLPLDYPHFWRGQLEDSNAHQELEDPGLTQLARVIARQLKLKIELEMVVSVAQSDSLIIIHT